MTLQQLRMNSFWMVVGALLCHEAVLPLVSGRGLPAWLSTGVTTVVTLGGAVTFVGAAFSWYDNRWQSLKEFAVHAVPVWLLSTAATVAAVGFHFLLLPLRLSKELHPLLVLLGGIGVFGVLVQALSLAMEARERSAAAGANQQAGW